MHLKLVEKEQFKTLQKPTVDSISNKIVDRTTNVSKTLRQNNLETVINEHDREIPKERYIFPEERQKIIDYLRLI